MYSLSDSPLLGRLMPRQTRYSTAHRVVVLLVMIFVTDFIATIPMYMLFTSATGDTLRALLQGVANGSVSEQMYTEAIMTLSETMSGSVAGILCCLWGTAATIGGCVLFVRLEEGKPLSAAGLSERPKRAVPGYLVGALAGLLMMGAAVGLLVLLKAVTVGRANGNLLVLCLLAVGYGIQGMAEEFLFRGVLLTWFLGDGRRNPWIALTLSAGLFALAHVGNNGFSILAFLNIMLFGLLTGLLTFRTGSVYAAAGLHSLWNFAEGCVFGISVSGLATTDSILSCVFVPGKTLSTGGAFGIEGGFATTLVFLVALLLLLFVPKKKEKPVVL